VASIPLMTETYSACYDGFTQITPGHRANSRVTVLPNQFIYLALIGLVAGIEEPLARVILALLDGGEGALGSWSSSGPDSEPGRVCMTSRSSESSVTCCTSSKVVYFSGK
jgi:hypothetical protein